MTVINVILILVLIYVLVWPRIRERFSTERLKDANGFSFLVQGGFADKQAGLKILSGVNEFNINVIRYLRNKYVRDDGREASDLPNSAYRASLVKNLMDRYDMDNLIEVNPTNDEKQTAYSRNKGEEMGLCMRSKMGFGLHPMPILYFVSLHELAHMAINEYGHTDGFWATFQWLMREAIASGLLEENSIPANGFEYCGINVSYNPLYDSNLAAI